MTDRDRELLAADQAARRMGVSEEWLRREARQRRIATVKFGSRVLFRPEDVDEFIRAHTREAVA